MWCLSRPNGAREFYATKAIADAAADADTASLVWFDSFDYETHNPGASPDRYQLAAQHERAIGLAYIAQRINELRRHVIDPWGPEAS